MLIAEVLNSVQNSEGSLFTKLDVLRLLNSIHIPSEPKKFHELIHYRASVVHGASNRYRYDTKDFEFLVKTEAEAREKAIEIFKSEHPNLSHQNVYITKIS